MLKTYADVASQYDISVNAFRDFLKEGTPLDEAIEKAKKIYKPITVDHKGKKWPSYTAMCKAYEQNPTSVRSRLKKGMTLKDALTEAPRNLTTGSITDPYGRVFANGNKACEHYGISSHAFYRHQSVEGHYTEELLGISPWLSNQTVDIDAAPGLKIIKPLGKEAALFLCKFDGHDIVLSRKQIVDECRERNRDKYLSE